MARERLRGSRVIGSQLRGQVGSGPLLVTRTTISVVCAAFNEQVALVRHGRRPPFGCQTEIRRKTDEDDCGRLFDNDRTNYEILLQ